MSAAAMGRVAKALAAAHPDNELFVDTHGPDPYRILVGCILSLRTKDDVSYPATERLFATAHTPEEMLRLEAGTIAKLIYPVGFYRRKSIQILEISRRLLAENGGRVPDTIDELLTLPGVGRKTANLTVTLGYGRPGICVDTHVHRISNRLGWVATRTPEQTEMRLRQIMPRRLWIPINELMVRHGQRVCHPTSPKCSMCAIARECGRVGVARSR